MHAEQLIKMHRDPEQYPNHHLADVHPNDVAEYITEGGWIVKEAECKFFDLRECVVCLRRNGKPLCIV